MSQPLRIAYPNAWYHVMNRGRRAENIFLDEFDYEGFVDLMYETSEARNLRIAAYCMIPIHYHMLVNLSDKKVAR